MKFSIIIIVFVISVSLVSCKSYQLTSDSLLEQLKANQTIAPNLYYQNFSLVNYPSNNFQKIKCEDKNGNCVWVFPDKNTTFKLIRKSTGEKVTLYFDTVLLQKDTLSGLKSRLFGGLRIVPLSDLEKVIVGTEFPHTEPCK